MTSDAPNQRNEGHESVTGAAAKGSESTAIPMLPPLPTNVREVPGHPSLLVPLYFSYPPNIRILSGRVRVRILLDDKGQVEEVRSVASNPPGFFDHTAIQVLRSGRFTPGFVGPMKVRSYLFMDVTFGPGSQGQQIWYVGSAFAPPAQPR
jgi:TonB family protein